MSTRLFRSVVLAAFLALGSQLQAADYYVDATGGSDRGSGRNASDPFKTISKINGLSLQPGDSVLFKRGEEWRETLMVSRSGLEGSPLTFGAYGTGENPRIWCTESFSNWTLAVDTPGAKIWTGAISGVKNAWGAMRSGVRVPRYVGYAVPDFKWSAPQDLSTMENGFFYSPLNSGLFYFRWDQGSPGAMEIGAREYGIYIANQRYVIVDGIDVCGPGGAAVSGSSDGKRQINIESCDHVEIRNAKFAHHNLGAIGIVGGSTNCVVSRATLHSHGNTALLFAYTGEGNGARECQVYDCGTSPTDRGDRGLIGVWMSPRVSLDDCYVHDNGFSDTAAVDAAVSFVRSPFGMVTRCLIQNAATTALQFAEGSYSSIATYNIIDGWGTKNLVSNTHNDGLRIGGGSREYDNGGCLIANNLFINGGQLGGKWAALKVVHSLNSNLQVLNNIFYDNGAGAEMYLESASDYEQWRFAANCFFKTKGHVVVIADGLLTYDSAHLFGAAKGYYSFDRGQEIGSIAVDPRIAVEARVLLAGSPCVGVGVPVGVSNDFNGDPVLSVAGINIGPFQRVLAPPTAPKLRLLNATLGATGM